MARSVTKLPKDPGPSGWNAILPDYEAPRVLKEHRTADWLIIGGGFAGLSAARRLTQLRPDDNVALVEAGRVGNGPAGRNSGFMIDLPHDLSSDNYSGSEQDQDRKQTEMNRTAIQFAREAAEEYGLGSDVLNPCGKINGAATEKGVRHNLAYAEKLANVGEASELLDARDMKDLTGIDYYLGGLYTPGTAMLQPAAYVRGLATALQQKIDLYEQTPAVSFKRVGSVWHVGTPEGSIEAPTVIMAVNGHIQSFGYYPKQLMHVFTYASMTRALTEDEINRLGGHRQWHITPADPMGATIRRISGTGGDRIIVRTRFTYDPSMEVSDDRLTSVGKAQQKSFDARFPMLAGMDMDYVWGGRLCVSWNGVPAFGPLDDGLISACCQNGLGAAKGTLSGMLAAELATKSNNPMIAEMMAQPAPKKLPPEPLTWFGANMTMRWREWKAGKEA
ncbi:NAD(P)/FAD-dependent oxidoreductase [Coralliovum pocilloporae]|uniref:NAD(P)/FAD-dependent oxidoreductase n=1 Tax=Coralliovum pocilloporae TaxID=3066369 RepID=UPI003306BC0F